MVSNSAIISTSVDIGASAPGTSRMQPLTSSADVYKKKYRSFVFTWNNYDDEAEEHLKLIACRYDLCCG